MSLANSAGIALGPRYAFDLTRPGLALYGGIPAPGAEGHRLPGTRIWEDEPSGDRIDAGEIL